MNQFQEHYQQWMLQQMMFQQNMQLQAQQQMQGTGYELLFALRERRMDFNDQLQKWERDFKQWKDDHLGHPNKEQFNRYLEQWKGWQMQMENTLRDIQKQIVNEEDAIRVRGMAVPPEQSRPKNRGKDKGQSKNSGMGPGMSSGMGPGMGLGMGLSMGSGMGPGMGSGMGLGMGQGMDPSMGQDIGPGMGSFMGPGMGSSMGVGPGMVPGMSPVVGLDMGPGMGSGMGPNMGPGQGPGMGPGMGPEMGPGAGMNVGMGPGVDSGMQPGVGPGVRPGSGPGKVGHRGPGGSRGGDPRRSGPGDLERMGPDRIGPRDSNERGPRGPAGIPPRGPRGMGPGIMGPGDMEPGGPGSFGPRGLPGPGTMDGPRMGPRGPREMGPRFASGKGPEKIGPRGPVGRGPRGPDQMGPRGPSGIGPRGPLEMGPLGPGNVGPIGPGDMGPIGLGSGGIGPRGPDGMGTVGPDRFGPRGPGIIGPRGPGPMEPRVPAEMGPTGLRGFQGPEHGMGPPGSGPQAVDSGIDMNPSGIKPGVMDRQGFGGPSVDFHMRNPNEMGMQGALPQGMDQTMGAQGMWQQGMPLPGMGQLDTEQNAMMAQTMGPLGMGPVGVMAQGTAARVHPAPEPPVVVVPSKPSKGNTTKDKAKTDLAPPGVDFFSPPTIGPPPKIPPAKPETEDAKSAVGTEKSEREDADKISAWPPTSQDGKVPLKKYPSVKKEAPLIIKPPPDQTEKSATKQSVAIPKEEPEKSPATTNKFKENSKVEKPESTAKSDDTKVAPNDDVVIVQEASRRDSEKVETGSKVKKEISASVKDKYNSLKLEEDAQKDAQSYIKLSKKNYTSIFPLRNRDRFRRRVSKSKSKSRSRSRSPHKINRSRSRSRSKSRNWSKNRSRSRTRSRSRSRNQSRNLSRSKSRSRSRNRSKNRSRSRSQGRNWRRNRSRSRTRSRSRSRSRSRGRDRSRRSWERGHGYGRDRGRNKSPYRGGNRIPFRGRYKSPDRSRLRSPNRDPLTRKEPFQKEPLERPSGRQAELPRSYRLDSPPRSEPLATQPVSATSVQELSEREHDIIRKAAQELKMIREQQKKLLPGGPEGEAAPLPDMLVDRLAPERRSPERIERERNPELERPERMLHPMDRPGPDRYRGGNEPGRFHPDDLPRYREEEAYPPRGEFYDREGVYRRGPPRYADDPYIADRYAEGPYRPYPPEDWEYEERTRIGRLRDIERRLDMELGFGRDRYDFDRRDPGRGYDRDLDYPRHRVEPRGLEAVDGKIVKSFDYGHGQGGDSPRAEQRYDRGDDRFDARDTRMLERYPEELSHKPEFYDERDPNRFGQDPPGRDFGPDDRKPGRFDPDHDRYERAPGRMDPEGSAGPYGEQPGRPYEGRQEGPQDMERRDYDRPMQLRDEPGQPDWQQQQQRRFEPQLHRTDREDRQFGQEAPRYGNEPRHCDQEVAGQRGDPFESDDSMFVSTSYPTTMGEYDSPHTGEEHPPLQVYPPPPPPPPSADEPKPKSVPIEDLLKNPGRSQRPKQIVIILRGPPGSGKTYVSKLIKNLETKMGGQVPRMLCLDDYFMTEVERMETDPETGKKFLLKVLEYEYEAVMEIAYRTSLLKSFKKTVDDGFFDVIIVDAINDKMQYVVPFRNYSKLKGFEVFVVEMMADAATCNKRDTHNRGLAEIQKIIRSFEPLPADYTRLDVRSLLQDDCIEEVEMEDFDEEAEAAARPKEEEEDEDDEGLGAFVKSKWETASGEKLDKLDGVRAYNKRKHSAEQSRVQSMEDFLSMSEYAQDTPRDPNAKRVRWADIEEKKDQERKRALGFVVGQTAQDWAKITDDNFAEKALNRTKYF
ncbi:uncharacterized protein LOC110983167 isoform X2 [Acanthaster planci]|uniref:YLP motif-containing protein 1 n=1 Tax=Acanthaster planci TaxID=133434 RepID=A0A8B7YX12_ACAPL|nr:uncharacterized protein LOC110983167 isoform X2 [Acanthaster planci]